MNDQLAKRDADQKAALVTVRDMLDKSRGQIQMALPRHLTVDRLIRVALTSIQRTPKLLECAPVTLIGAIIQSAQLGLEPDGVTGQAYLVPFWNSQKNRFEVQFIPGYKGLVTLARRSQEVSTVEARVVREEDTFRFRYGLDPILEHEPSTEEDAGAPKYFYAIARLRDRGVQFDVMPVREIDAIRARSKAKDNGPWVTDYDEMGKKTVLRRLCKLLPASVELQRAAALDEYAAIGKPQDLGILADRDETGTDEGQPKDTPTPPQRKSQNGNGQAKEAGEAQTTGAAVPTAGAGAGEIPDARSTDGTLTGVLIGNIYLTEPKKKGDSKTATIVDEHGVSYVTADPVLVLTAQTAKEKGYRMELTSERRGDTSVLIEMTRVNGGAK